MSVDFWRPMMRRLMNGIRQAIISLAAGFAAYLPAHELGLAQAFWGAITALAVTQAKLGDTEALARKQFVGAAVGGAVSLCLILTLGEGLGIYAAAVVLSILACWLLKASDSSQLAGITATIILLVPHAGRPERMLAARLSEVTWGVCVGIAVVWVEERVAARLAHPHAGPNRE